MGNNASHKILLVEDNVHFLTFLKDNLGGEYALDVAENFEAAIEKLQQMNYHLVLLDLGLPRRPGMPTEVLGFDLLQRIKSQDPTVEVIILTATSREIERAVQAIRNGAYDFLVKDDNFEVFPEKLRASMQNALQKRDLERSNRTLQKQVKYFVEQQKQVHKYRHPDLNYHFGFLLGESKTMQDVYTMIDKLSTRTPNETVLIEGESGTGKDLAARSIHLQSPRLDQPLVVANIASLPVTLVEYELFGIEPKTATGVDGKTGCFEQAEGSSIFLDEIAEVPIDIQAKLLRVLDQKEIQRLGAAKPTVVDVRVIAATNKNLKELVKQGKFREDLYFRLDVVSIKLPALRERRKDIPLLIKHILYSQQQEERNPNLSIAPEAIHLLQENDWPGNVRELENVVKKAIVQRDQDMLTPDDFYKWLPPSPPIDIRLSSNGILEPLPLLQNLGSAFKNIPEETRHKVLLRTLIESEGSMEEVLDRLDVARNTAYKFLGEAENLLLAGLCHSQLQSQRLANVWGVDADKLDKTIHRANRLTAYFQELNKRFANDQTRLSMYLNVNAEQLEKLRAYLQALQK
jgi:DNA-binding NtrC family response regulator